MKGAKFYDDDWYVRLKYGSRHGLLTQAASDCVCPGENTILPGIFMPKTEKEHKNMVTLQEITVENFDCVIGLQVADDQRNLVASNVESIAQAWVQPECIPLAIYKADTPVGFVMYCVDRDDGEYWLYRLMIDKEHQGQGYGRAAMEQVLARVKSDSAHHRIFLGVDQAGVASLALYQALGFQFDGRIYGKEHIMVLEY